MIANLRPYPMMKESGVEWIGDVPTHWKVLPSRAVFEEIRERDRPDKQMLSVTINRGVVLQNILLEENSKKDSSNIDKSAYKVVMPGDIAYNKMRAWQGAIGASDYQGIVSPAYVVERPRKGVSSRYCHYLLRTPAFAKEAERWSYGITSDMWSLRPEHFKMIYVCIPPFTEQVAIARFLDHADRLIRRYIRAKQKLIALLEEQKQAIIREAVTGQIDVRTGRPYPLYKTSGEEWLGDVPEHWRVRKLSWLFRYSKGSNAAALTKEYIGLHRGRYRVYSGQTENGGLMGVIDSFEFEYSTPMILVTTVGARAMSTRLVSGRFSLSQNCALIVPREQTLDTSYYEGVLGIMFDFERRSISLTMQPSLRFEDLDKFRVPIPPSEEQRAIARYIIRSVAEMNSVSSHADRAIKLLNEYRTCLIADVVTGKLDVRSAAAELHNGRSPQT